MKDHRRHACEASPVPPATTSPTPARIQKPHEEVCSEPLGAPSAPVRAGEEGPLRMRPLTTPQQAGMTAAPLGNLHSSCVASFTETALEATHSDLPVCTDMQRGSPSPSPPLDSVRPRRIGLPAQSRRFSCDLHQELPGDPKEPENFCSSQRRPQLSLAAHKGRESLAPSALELSTTAAEEPTSCVFLLSPSEPSPKDPSDGNDSPWPSREEAVAPSDTLASLFDSKWIYQSTEELLQHYMSRQEAAHPKSSAAALGPSLKSYCVSLYSWGWALVPFRCSCSWLQEAGPVLLAGFFIPFSLVPTAMTCAVISGLPVSATLNSCWILSLISSLLGGAPGTVSAVTEAISTALVATVIEDCSGEECRYSGRDYIFPAGILCGLVQCVCGLMGFGRYIALVPSASKVGYVAAIAIINLRSQLHAFKYDPVTSTGYEWVIVLGLILEACLLMHFWPLLAPCKLSAYLPASAVALGASVATEFCMVRKILKMKTKTVGDVSSLAGGGNLPSLFYLSPAFAPPSKEMLSFKGLYMLLEVALTLVLLSSMSTVMTLEKVQERSRWAFKCDRQLIALGAANSVSSFFGCLPGTTGMMVSLLANRMGASGKEAPLLAAMFLFIFTSAAYHVLDAIPLGGLSGAIIYTAGNAVSWRTVPPLVAALLPRSLCRRYKCLHMRLSKTEAIVVLLTTVLGATFDLGSALLVGFFISICSFAWGSFRAFSLDSQTDPETNTKYYFVNGPLFFSTVKQLAKQFDEQTAPKRSVVVVHAAAASADHAVLTVLAEIVRKHEAVGKEMVVYGINPRGRLLGLHAGRLLERDKDHIVAKMRLSAG